ncbi:MAG: hypothetical protein DMG17_00240, partial [Acidobacteria bacterium]
KMLGYTDEEIGKVTFLELTHEDYREANWKLVTELLEGKRRQFQIEKQYRRKDGSLIWVSNNVSLVPGTNSMPRFIMALAEDITERKQAEEMLRRSQAKLEKAFEEIKRLKDRLQDENLILREKIDDAFMFDDIVGSSPVLQSVLSSIVRVAPTDTTILISGETGSGKELISRAIHKRSRRSNQAFVSINCAAIPPSLIASELFGHEKGAFTGAVQQRRGRFELAHSGTIFLDEIGEVPVETQLALLTCCWKSKHGRNRRHRDCRRGDGCHRPEADRSRTSAEQSAFSRCAETQSNRLRRNGRKYEAHILVRGSGPDLRVRSGDGTDARVDTATSSS